MKLLKTGDEIIAASDMYGGTYRLFSKVYTKFGLVFHYVDMSNVDNIEEKINSNRGFLNLIVFFTPPPV